MPLKGLCMESVYLLLPLAYKFHLENFAEGWRGCNKLLWSRCACSWLRKGLREYSSWLEAPPVWIVVIRLPHEASLIAPIDGDVTEGYYLREFVFSIIFLQLALIVIELKWEIGLQISCSYGGVWASIVELHSQIELSQVKYNISIVDIVIFVEWRVANSVLLSVDSHINLQN